MPKVSYFDFYSHVLGFHLKVEVTGHWGYPVLMFPTSNGSFTQNRDFGLNGSVNWFTDNGKVKLYNIQTIDSLSFYNKKLSPWEKVYNYNKYVQFLRQEFIPFIQKDAQTHRLAVAGCSFGGFHAANIALRYPDLFSHLFSMSGAFSIRNFCPNVNDQMAYFNCPEEFMGNEQGWRYNHMNIVLGTSDWDICLDKNQNFAKILHSKGINFWFDEKKWANHDWPLWNLMFPQYLGTYFS